MTLNDNLIASIQAELEVLKEEAAPAPVATVEVAPIVDDSVPPVIRLAREQAARLQGK